MEYPSLSKPTAGSIRFNTDSSKMEYYDGNQWVNITSTSPEAQTGGTRGMFNGGMAPLYHCCYINVDTTGNAIDFGDLKVANLWGRGGSSDVHGGIA